MSYVDTDFFCSYSTACGQFLLSESLTFFAFENAFKSISFTYLKLTEYVIAYINIFTANSAFAHWWNISVVAEYMLM